MQRLSRELDELGHAERSFDINATSAVWIATSLPRAPIAMLRLPAASARCVVHAIADDEDLAAFVLERLDRIPFLLGQTVGLEFR
ncbi:MAG: hypothetical protein WDO13_17565 [Verrucomicrobiota bacterium]